jgi:hypothetical protein
MTIGDRVISNAVRGLSSFGLVDQYQNREVYMSLWPKTREELNAIVNRHLKHRNIASFFL